MKAMKSMKAMKEMKATKVMKAMKAMKKMKAVKATKAKLVASPALVRAQCVICEKTRRMCDINVHSTGKAVDQYSLVCNECEAN